MANKDLSYFSSKDFIEKISLLINDIVDSDNEKSALELMDVIISIFKSNKELEKIYPDIYNKLFSILIKAKFICLPSLRKEEVINLIKNYFSEIFNITAYDLERKFKYYLSGLDDLKERDEFKRQMRNFLLENNEIITMKEIKINNLSVKPTISNWLKDYNMKLGTELVDKLKASQYFVNDNNFKALNNEEIGKLKMLFDFYEKTKTSSTTAEGLEENFVAILPNNEINLVSGGKLNKINSAIIKIYNEINKNKSKENKGLEELRAMASQYPAGSLERKAVEEEIGKISKS